MRPKRFKLKEANKIVPKLEKEFEEIFVLRKKIAILQAEISWLAEFWGKDLHDNDNPDDKRFERINIEVEHMHKKVVDRINKIQKMGCIVKDIDNGLVDFYSNIDGLDGFLCWRFGEKEIHFWHDIRIGTNTRIPLSGAEGI